jgi:predicted TIM-barrel fold metal-dependent hydrolase
LIEQNKTPPLVDSHAHAYTLSMPLASTAWHRPATEATVEQYLETLDAHGVRYGVRCAARRFGTDTP